MCHLVSIDDSYDHKLAVVLSVTEVYLSEGSFYYEVVSSLRLTSFDFNEFYPSLLQRAIMS